MSTTHAFHASARFGLGAKPGELRAIGGDPRGWLMQQLRAPKIPPEVKKREGGAALVEDAVNAIRKNDSEKAAQTIMKGREIYIRETGNRMLAHLRSDQPFVEQLVLFWSNHFTVSIQKPLLMPIVNPYEAEAIRPHVNGYFRDMLLAVTRHPAMLFYLDNVQSTGPDSRAGKNRGKGRNENLAREILELHTLGVNGGYTQADVIALADIITGWALEDGGITGAKPAYKFRPFMHQPGEKTLLGQRFREDGEAEGIAALTMLARHPATAKHIATKLARRFIDDAPPAAAVETIAASFLKSDGHLPTVMQTLINLNEAWQRPLAKFKTPYEFVVSALRLTGITPTPEQTAMGLEALNYRPFNAGSPAGDGDTAEVWAAPDAVMKRIEWGHRLAQRLPAGIDPMQLASLGLGDIMSASTKQAIQRAASGAEGIALLLASPEFQRR